MTELQKAREREANQVTKAQIATASTKELQGIYALLMGKPTSNRNATALRARLTGMVEARAQVERVREQLKSETWPYKTLPGKAKPSKTVDKPSLFLSVEKTVKPATEPVKVQDEKLDRGFAIPTAPAPFSETLKQGSRYAVPPRPARSIAIPAAPAKAKRAPRVAGVTAEHKRTKTMLAALPVGIELYHTYRNGTETRVKLLEPMTADGKGGRFLELGSRVPLREFVGLTGLRNCVKAHSGHAWNVLLFFKRSDTDKPLVPYPKHKKKDAPASEGLTAEQREFVIERTREQLDREAAAKPKKRGR